MENSVNSTPIKRDDLNEYDENNKLVAVAAQHRGDTMAFAVQQILYNIGGNFFEPYISSRVQRHYAEKHLHQFKAGSYAQNLGGDFAGDIIGGSSLMIAELVAPIQLHTATRAMRHAIDPIYTTIANHVFSGRENEPGFAERKEAWKLAQERSLVRSAMMMTGGVIGNIATQKYIIKNPAPAKIIFLGKLASSAVTNAVGLVVRAVFPEQTQGLDKWMSKNWFTPLFEDKAEQAQGR